MKTKRLLITWWLWYIGSHMVERAIRDWFDVTIIDDMSNTSVTVLDNINKIFNTEWYKIDREYDLRLISKSYWKITIDDLYENNYSACINFAWFKAVWESCENPFKYYKNNLNEFINFLEVLDKKWIKDFIFSSSATVYEWEWEFDEHTSTWTTNPYWTTKLVSEMILEDLVKFKWFNVVSLRYFNPIGSHSSKLIWEYTEQPNNLLPIIAEVIVWKRKELKVYWDDYKTKDWTCERDYIWINDLIDWHMKAYDSFIKDRLSVWDFYTMNLWTWKPMSVLEMKDLVEKATWLTIPFSIWERREWDKWSFYANSDLAKNVIWFKVKDEYEKIIKDYIDFFKSEYEKK